MTDTFPDLVANPTFKSGGLSAEAKVNESQFGDGYTQRGLDGYNNITDNWDLTWENVSTVEKTTLDSFLRSQMGYKAFYWTAPGDDAPKKWTCKTWKYVPIDAGYWTFSASFRKEFDP